MYREPPATRQKRYAVRLSRSLFKIHVTSPDFKKRRTDRRFCTIGTTNAVLDYSLYGGDILVNPLVGLRVKRLASVVYGAAPKVLTGVFGHTGHLLSMMLKLRCV
jgi:hypothetical protein